MNLIDPPRLVNGHSKREWRVALLCHSGFVIGRRYSIPPMPQRPEKLVPPPPIIALAAWLLPGLGYWLLGQRGRAMVVGISVLTLFALGLLIGDIRVLEVPMFNEHGRQVENAEIMRELRSKPWSIAQVLTGPAGIACGFWSVWA